MTSTWEAEALNGVPGDPRELASDIASRLGAPTAAVVTVVELHLQALDGALSLCAPELLADHLRWQSVRLRSAHADFGSHQLDEAVDARLAELVDKAALLQVRGMYAASMELTDGQRSVSEAVELPEGRARTYLLATLSSDREGAIQVVREAMDSLEVADIMLDILQPAQEELGRLWETGEISIAHEHYTTAITQLCLSLLYPRLLSNRTLLGHRLVATSVGSEAHEVGIRMISDLFEQGGWRTTFLGSDVPDHDIIEFAVQQRADVLAVSATMSGHVAAVRRLIDSLRADPRAQDMKVLVGGRPFSANPRLAEVVGADGWAPSAREAFELCRAWTEERVGSV